MKEQIIASLGIALALVCSIIGWWMENGPERKNKRDHQDDENNLDETE